MGRQAGVFRAQVVILHIADHGCNVSRRYGIQLTPVDAILFPNPVLTTGDDGIQVDLLRSRYALQRMFLGGFRNRDMRGTHVDSLRRSAGSFSVPNLECLRTSAGGTV